MNSNNNKYISEPRGVPKDVSEVVKKEIGYWGSDGHSHSYFTLKELKQFLVDNPTQRYEGYMSPEDAKLVSKGEMPHMWWEYGDVPNQVFRVWEYKNTVLDDLLSKLEELKRDEFWIFNDEDRPEFDDKIRIVFWFDN